MFPCLIFLLVFVFWMVEVDRCRVLTFFPKQNKKMGCVNAHKSIKLIFFFSGNCLISDDNVSIGSGCMIGPDVVIGPGVTIGNCVRLQSCCIMGGTRIGDGAYVSNAIVTVISYLHLFYSILFQFISVE